MKLAGKSIDGRLVVKDTFKYTDTYGIPMDIVNDFLKSKGYLVDKDDFIRQAIESNWHPNKIKRIIHECRL